MSKFVIVTIVIFLSSAVLGVELPEGLIRCSRTDPEVNVCLAKAIEESLRFFKDGNKMLGIPPIDPYRLDHAVADHTKTSGSSNFNLKSSLTNADIIGFSTVKVNKVASKLDTMFGIKGQASVEELVLAGDYTMDGQMLLPIRGKGKMKLVLYNATATLTLKGNFYEKEGMTHVNVTTFALKLTPKRATFSFENIFNGDKTLSNTINQFMNENWEVVINTLLPEYEKRVGDKFREVSNQLFEKVPINAVFRDW